MARTTKSKKGAKAQAAPSTSQPATRRRTRSTASPPASQAQAQAQAQAQPPPSSSATSSKPTTEAAPKRMTRSRAEALGTEVPDKFETPPDVKRTSNKGGRRGSRAGSRSSKASSRHSTRSPEVGVEVEDFGSDIHSQNQETRSSDSNRRHTRSSSSSLQQVVPSIEILPTIQSSTSESPHDNNGDLTPKASSLNQSEQFYDEQGEEDVSFVASRDPSEQLLDEQRSRASMEPSVSEPPPTPPSQQQQQLRRSTRQSSISILEVVEEDKPLNIPSDGSGDETFQEADSRIYVGTEEQQEDQPEQSEITDDDTSDFDPSEQLHEEQRSAIASNRFIDYPTDPEVSEISSVSGLAAQILNNVQAEPTSPSPATGDIPEMSEIATTPLTAERRLDLQTARLASGLVTQTSGFGSVYGSHPPLGSKLTEDSFTPSTESQATIKPNSQLSPNATKTLQSSPDLRQRTETFAQTRQDAPSSDDEKEDEDIIKPEEEEEDEMELEDSFASVQEYQPHGKRQNLFDRIPRSNQDQNSPPKESPVINIIDDDNEEDESEQMEQMEQMDHEEPVPQDFMRRSRATNGDTNINRLRQVTGEKSRVYKSYRRWQPSASTSASASASTSTSASTSAHNSPLTSNRRASGTSLARRIVTPSQPVYATPIRRRLAAIFREPNASLEPNKETYNVIEPPKAFETPNTASTKKKNLKKTAKDEDAESKEPTVETEKKWNNQPPATPKSILLSPLKPIIDTAARMFPSFFRSQTTASSKKEESSSREEEGQPNDGMQEELSLSNIENGHDYPASPTPQMTRIANGHSSKLAGKTEITFPDVRNSVSNGDMEDSDSVGSGQKRVRFNDGEDIGERPSKRVSYSTPSYKERPQRRPMSIRRQRVIRRTYQSFQERLELRNQNLLPPEIEDERIEREKNEAEMQYLNAKDDSRRTTDHEMEDPVENQSRNPSTGTSFSVPDFNMDDSEEDAADGILDVEPSTADESSSLKSSFGSRPSTIPPPPGSFFSNDILKTMGLVESRQGNLFGGPKFTEGTAEEEEDQEGTPKNVGMTFAVPDINSSILDDSMLSESERYNPQEEPDFKSKSLSEWNAKDYNDYLKYENAYSPKILTETAEAMRTGQVPPVLKPLKRTLDEMYARAEREVQSSKKRKLAEVETLEWEVARRKAELEDLLSKIKRRKDSALRNLSDSEGDDVEALEDEYQQLSGNGPIWSKPPPPSPSPAHARLPRSPSKGSVTFASSTKTNDVSSPGPSKPVSGSNPMVDGGNNANSSPLKPALKTTSSKNGSTGELNRSPNKSIPIEDENRSSLTGRQRESYERKMSEVNKYAPKQPSRLREASQPSTPNGNVSAQSATRMLEKFGDSNATSFQSDVNGADPFESFDSATPGEESTNIFAAAAKLAAPKAPFISDKADKFAVSGLFPDVLSLDPPTDPAIRSLTSSIDIRSLTIPDLDLFGSSHARGQLPLFIDDANTGSALEVRRAINAAMAG